MKSHRLPPGLYEQIISNFLHQQLSGIDSSFVDVKKIDEGESHDLLAEYLQKIISASLKGITGNNKLERQISICNEIIEWLKISIEDGRSETDYCVHESAQRLLSIADLSFQLPRHYERPETPLSVNCILTGTRFDSSLESQIKKEIVSSSPIDILCSFIKWTGCMRIMQSATICFTGNHKALRLKPRQPAGDILNTNEMDT